jgi:RimJ/RimL family protein N-acetyltransferase
VRLEEGHSEDFFAMHQDEKVMATLGGVRSEAETRDYLRQNLQHWLEHGFGLWVLRDPHAGHFLGRAGLRHVVLNGRPEIELAYALRADQWQKGLATEIAEACVQKGFGELQLDDLVCFALKGNQASRRVMEKVGFRKEADLVRGGHPHILCRLTRDQWQARAELRQNTA